MFYYYSHTNGMLVVMADKSRALYPLQSLGSGKSFKCCLHFSALKINHLLAFYIKCFWQTLISPSILK